MHKSLTILLQAVILGYRKSFVTMFPGLFKEHKDRYKDRSNNKTITRVFILFLDRRVENNSKLVRYFYFMVLCILFAAVFVFCRYVPTAVSGECLERDAKNRDLYCYTNLTNSYFDYYLSDLYSMPVDCAVYNSTELEEMDFVCYAITITDLGVALAAAGALAKLATVCITIYIRVSAAICMWSRCNREQYCGLSAKCIYIIYLVLTLLALLVFGIICYSVLLTIEYSQRPTALMNNPSYLVYAVYGAVPFMLLVPLLLIMRSLDKHCNQEEYISYCTYQMPDCEDDCDVYVEPTNDREEPEESDHEPGVDRRSSTPDQAEGTQLVAYSDNTTSYCTFTTGSIQ